MITSLRVTLLDSDNQYLPHPCNGTLEIWEVGTFGQIVKAVFRMEEVGPNGYISQKAPVGVTGPVFKYPVEPLPA